MSPLDPEAAVPAGRMTLGFRRWLSVLVGVAALSAAVLSWVEADSGRREEQAFVKASRGSLDIFVKLATSAPRAQFEGNATRRALAVQAEGLGRVVATSTGSEAFDYALALSQAEQEAGRRLRQVAEAMSSAPERVPGLDTATLEALRASLVEVASLVEAQNEVLDDADRYGVRQERSFFSLGLVASSAALLGLAGLMGAGRAGRISLVTAGAALLVAVLWTASAFVI